jgi:MoaA/NifB/PqqE/SkfB family radical SAM enzyme
MIHDEIPLKTSKENLELQSKLIKNRHSIEQVLFAYDSSCNLSCPSCRKVKIMEKATEANAKVIAVTEKLLPILGGLKVININPAGELFASKASRRILQYISDETCKDLKIEIISNGTLFNEDEWNKFPGIHNKIKSVRISIDAATKLTFEKLRRLAYYDIFMDNMQFISKLKNNNTIPQLQFSFTYQLDNYNEMPEFVNFGRSMNADLVIFERLQNLGAYTNDEYRHRAVHLYGHDKYFEFINIIQQPIMQQSYVMNDFQI